MIVWRCIKQLMMHSTGFTLVILVILTVTIGANAAMFSIINGVLLRPLPYRNSTRLFAVHEVLPKLSHIYPTIPVSAYDFQQWRRHTTAFEGLALLDGSMVSLTSQGEPERIPLGRVSANLFTMLGIQPTLGRTFREEEDLPGNDRVVIISNALWRRRFQANPNAIGQTLTLDGIPYAIIGIAPANIPALRANELRPAGRQDREPEIWKPFGITRDESQPFGDWNYSCIALLKPQVSVSQALAELDAVEVSIDASAPEKSGLHAVLIPLQEQIAGKSRGRLLLLLAAVFIVLLIGCTNVSNLILVRANDKRRERAIQSALGASAARLRIQALSEGLSLAILGGLGGLAFAYVSLNLLRASGIDLPRLREIRLDWSMLTFNFLVALFIGVVLGLAPSWRSSRTDILDVLKSSGQAVVGGKHKRLRSLFVILEVGLTTASLIVAGLLLHSFLRLMNVDEGFDSRQVIAMTLSLPELQYRERPQRAEVVEQVSQRLQAVPGIEAVGIASLLPLTGEGDNNIITVENTTTPKMERPVAEFRSVNPGFFEVLRIPLKTGRIFNPADKNRNVSVISAQAAARFFPGVDPIGKKFHLGDESRPLLEVVGIVGDVRSSSLEKPPYPTVYLPYWQRLGFDLFVTVRTPLAPSAISSSIRREIQQIDPELPISEIRTMREIIDNSVIERKFQLQLVLVFAIVATTLTGIGIYSIVSYATLRRTNELGLRLALGASPWSVVWLIMRQGMFPIGTGLAVGLAVSVLLGNIIRSSLFGVASYDPWTFIAVAVFLLTIGLLACFMPARRAFELDPLRTLRYE